PFEPIEPGRVHLYVCGPTVYDDCHIGHGRSSVVFDVVVRFFRAVGFQVTYVRNFTDVDDKIINRANETGVPPEELAERFIRAFYRDMDALFVQRADIEPKVTEHIDDIVGFIRRLMEKDYAYEVDGNVYFSVDRFPVYGKLSGRKLEDMMAGARVDINEEKNNPFDFALWKTAKPGEPNWKSPWGQGRPGWHIECSAMGGRHLGPTFDIHGGGKDLIFPHHENEIAQSEAAHGVPLANYWMHNGFVNINEEKMSKSLGNFLMIKDILQQVHPETVRLFLLTSHYRSPIDFSEKAIGEADSAMDRIIGGMARLEGCLGTPEESVSTGEGGALWRRFRIAMEDDFNTAKGLAEIFDAIHQVNRSLDHTPDPDGDERSLLTSLYRDIRRCTRVLGLMNSSADSLAESKRHLGLTREAVDPARIDALIHERTEARKAKNFDRADAIREELEAMNVLLEDRPEGTVWKINR
ncbi:MAG: cysteine--tRNA ligase, partial [Desulfobacterales bacterium]